MQGVSGGSEMRGGDMKMTSDSSVMTVTFYLGLGRNAPFF